MDKIKSEIIQAGKWIWEKDLTAAMSGNISVRVCENEIFITGRGTCLGMLEDNNIGKIDLKGNPLDKSFAPSSETIFHTSVYKELDAKVVVHVHPVFSNGFFAVRDTITFDTFETRLTLGDIPVIDQKTPTITDVSGVIAALKKSNVIVLKHHGVVAIGDTLQDAFFLIQTLEEAVKMACIRDLCALDRRPGVSQGQKAETRQEAASAGKKYKLFSDEQVQEIVQLVNADEKFKRMAKETSLETKLAVVLEETGATYCFNFSGGQIKDYSYAAQDAEFIISGRADYWRAIFNRQLDPFAATTQKKLKLKGDFAKISRWYVPFNRLFELWTSVPVE